MKTLILLLFVTSTAWAQQAQGLPDYAAYAQNPGLANIDSLQAVIATQDPLRTDIRSWLESVLASHLENQPLDIANLSALNDNIELGIQLMNTTSVEISIISDDLLQAACDSIQVGLNTYRLDKTDDKVLATIDRLMSVQYMVNIPKSDNEKLWENLRNCEFRYLFTRLKTRCFIDCANGNCQSTCQVFWVLLVVGFIMLVVLIWKWKHIWQLLAKRKIKN